MANFSPESNPGTEPGGGAHRTPPDLGPGHTQAANNKNDPRGDLFRAESTGDHSPYDSEAQSGGSPTYRTPPDLGPGHTQAANNKNDPRGDLSRAESGGDGPNGPNGSDNFNFNSKGDDEGSGGSGAAGQAAREIAMGGGVAGAAKAALGGARNMFLGSRRRKQTTFGGGFIALIIGSIMLMLGISSGPAELVQLAHMIERSYGNSQNASSSRLDKLFRYAGANDVGETRLGYLERKVVRPQIEELSNMGIDFDLNQVAGLNGTTIDTDKLAETEKFSDLKDIPAAERGDYLASNIFSNVADAGGEFHYNGDGTYEISGANSELSSLSFDRLTASDALGALDDNGALASALNLRVMGKYLGVPSLFHPFSRQAAQKLKDAIDTAKSQSDAEEQAVQEEEGNVQSPVENAAGAEDAAKSIEDEGSSFKDTAVSSLALFGGACFAKNIAGDINTVNKTRIAEPAVAEGLNFLAVGNAIENGSSADMGLIQAMGKSLTNNAGQAIWSAQALQALSGNAEHAGTDLSPDYQQAFLGSGIANTITSWANSVLAFFPIPTAVGGPCGTVGTVLQIGGTLAASVASAVAELGSFGAATPAVAGWWALEQGSQFGETAVAMHFVEGFVLNSTTDSKLAKDAFSGPLGGNLIAYGARYGADIAGAAEGLVPLQNTNSVSVSPEVEKQSQQQFTSEGLFARLFDVNDYRSLAGHLADSMGPGMMTNFADSISNISGLGSNLLSNFSSIFLPKSLAAPPGYNWGFPLFGLPSNLENTTDPSLANPYANADQVATLLSSSSGSSYVSKAKSCFGVDLTQTQDDSGNNIWDVTPNQSIDMTSNDYQSQNCGSTSDPNWQRVILFVLDTQTMKAVACWTGDDQSCQGIGYGNSSPSGGSGSPTGNPDPGGFGSGGSGPFTTDTSQPAYPGLDQMLARVKAAAQPNASASATAAFCASIGGCSGRCESAVEMAWLGHTGQYNDPFGNTDPNGPPGPDSAWGAAVASGHAHPGDRNPPVGALLIYSIPGDQFGHITIYLGNNMVFSTDFDYQGQVGVEPASHIETATWANSYIGWMDPLFSGKVGN